MFTTIGLIVVSVITIGGLAGIGMTAALTGDILAVIVFAVFVIGVCFVLFIIIKPPIFFKKKNNI